MDTKMEDACQICGSVSDYGCHGIRDNMVYDEFYCGTCWTSKRTGQAQAKAPMDEELQQGLA